MQFKVKKASNGSERVGVLTELVDNPNAVIETPVCALLTQGGSVVHLTAEVLSQVFSTSHLLWVPLSNSLSLEPGVKAQGKGLAEFAGISDHVTCVTFNNMNEITPAGHFEPDAVPLWTKQGKKLISAERYMDVMELFQPDIFFTLADSRISLNEGFKRVAKSVERTCSLLDKCVSRYKGSKVLKHKSSLVGVVVAPGDVKKCNDCISRILSHSDTLSGVALSGLTDGREDHNGISVEKLQEIFLRVGNAIPENLIRFVEGSWSPSVMMHAVECGWDVIDGSYAVKLTNAGQALVLNFDVTRLCEGSCVLDLIDERYREDFSPVLTGCECLTCKKHTRAYIRHLLNTREMLASVLLNIHNLHHFDQLFHHVRLHIAADTFSIYKNHITSQFDRHTPQLNGKAEQTNEIKVKESAVKKKRVSNGDHALNGCIG